MNRNIKRLGDLLGKLTIEQATEIGLSSEELGALLTAQQKVTGVYDALIHNTERAMAGESMMPNEDHALAVLGFLHFNMKIQAIKLLRTYVSCNLVTAKRVVEETQTKMAGNAKPTELISWLVGEMQRSQGR